MAGPTLHEIEFQVCYRRASLPVSEPIKIRDACIVRNGHHRISVAKYMGSDFIDARVTEWVLAD